MRAEGTSCGGDGRGAGATNQGQRQVAEGRDQLRGVAGAEARVIFVKGDVAHRVAAVLDAPVLAHEAQERRWVGSFRRQGGDEIDYFACRPPLGADAPGEPSDLRDVGPG